MKILSFVVSKIAILYQKLLITGSSFFLCMEYGYMWVTQQNFKSVTLILLELWKKEVSQTTPLSYFFWGVMATVNKFQQYLQMATNYCWISITIKKYQHETWQGHWWYLMEHTKKISGPLHDKNVNFTNLPVSQKLLKLETWDLVGW